VKRLIVMAFVRVVTFVAAPALALIMSTVALGQPIEVTVYVDTAYEINGLPGVGIKRAQ
jgi:hypothetical protein